MKLKFRGQSEMFANTKRYSAAFPNRLGQSIYRQLNIDVKEMKKRTPVLSGDLRDSEHVTEPEIQGQVVKCSVVCGVTDAGEDLLYARKQHFDLELNHPNGGQAYFMTSVLNESSPHMAERIAQDMRDHK